MAYFSDDMQLVQETSFGSSLVGGSCFVPVIPPYQTGMVWYVWYVWYGMVWYGMVLWW